MGKRLTITDFLFAFLFIFMFFCIIVAFFYGVNVGKTRAAEQYEQLLHTEEPLSEDMTSYHQQHLVSFYYNVYYPFRTFQSAWTNELNNLSTGQASDARAALKQLSRTAAEVYLSIEDTTLPETSPLLRQAQTNYLRSLRLFEEADSRAKDLSGSDRDIVRALQEDTYIIDAVNYAVTAQDNYYEAIVKWHESLVVELHGAELHSNADISLSEWFSLPFNVKNSIIAQALLDHQIFANYAPQDVTAVLHSMIDTGRTQSLGVDTVYDTVRLLHDTNAVRSGDYFAYKDAYFQEEVMPQLPFYNEQ